MQKSIFIFIALYPSCSSLFIKKLVAAIHPFPFTIDASVARRSWPVRFCRKHPSHAQTALDDILKTKEMTVAIPTGFPPYGFVGPDLKPQGLDGGMAACIAGKLGAKLEPVFVTSATRVPYLQTKKADLVISTLGKNAE